MTRKRSNYAKFLLALLGLVSTVSLDGEANKCSLSKGKSTSLPAGSSASESIIFSPNGLYLATANPNTPNDVTLFSIDKEVVRRGTSDALPMGSSTPFTAQFSPNGAYLATANNGSDGIKLFVFPRNSMSKPHSVSKGTTFPLSKSNKK